MVYTGMTKLPLHKRTGKNGIRYCRHPFYQKILDTGWDNIEKVIVRDGLAVEEARTLEKERIQFWSSQDLSLNCSAGGECSQFIYDIVTESGDKISSKEVAALAKTEGITPSLVRGRLSDGWDLERIITQPTNVKRQPHGVGDKIFELNGKMYNSYELVQMSNVEVL